MFPNSPRWVDYQVLFIMDGGYFKLRGVDGSVREDLHHKSLFVISLSEFIGDVIIAGSEDRRRTLCRTAKTSNCDRLLSKLTRRTPESARLS
jgi:hypothetical protein